MKLWIDNSTGGTPAATQLLDQAIDAQVIGFVVLPHAPLALGAVEMTVARHHRAVGDAHDERRIVEAAIGIDQQTREARENGGRVQHLRRRACVTAAAPIS